MRDTLKRTRILTSGRRNCIAALFSASDATQWFVVDLSVSDSKNTTLNVPLTALSVIWPTIVPGAMEQSGTSMARMI